MQFDECRRSDFNKIPNYQSWPQGLKLRTGSCRHNQINTRHMYAQFFLYQQMLYRAYSDCDEGLS